MPSVYEGLMMDNNFDTTPFELAMRSYQASQNATHLAGHTPQWVIECQDIFNSTSKEEWGGNGTPCLWVKLGSKRLISHDCSGQLTGDGRILPSDTVVCMKHGTWGPMLEMCMWNHVTLANVKIHRIMQAQGETVILQTFEHTTCCVKNYQQEGDYIEFSFNFMMFKDIFIKYDKEGGKVGQVASFYNYETLESDIEA